MKMISTEIYYYSDAAFQLEINLQNKRRELIAMLESVEQGDCLVCYQLKCRCITTVNGTDADKQSTTNNAEEPAPPTPEKENMDEEIEAWIKSSKIIDTKDISESEKKKLQLKQTLLNNGAAVEAFFKSFKLPPKSVFLSNKLAEAFVRANQTKADYSYF